MKEKDNFSKDNCLTLVNNLENVKRWELENSPLATALAEFIFGYRRDIRYYALDLELLNALVPRLAPLQTEGEGTLRSGFLTPDILLDSDFLADRILPWVQLVRTELFASPEDGQGNLWIDEWWPTPMDAPFSSNKDAENWIQEKAKKVPEQAGPDERDMRERLVHELIQDTLGGVSVGFPLGRNFEYLGEDGKVHQIKIRGPEFEDWEIWQFRQQYVPNEWSRLDLSWLENETRIMSRATGFTQPSLVQFVLVGIRPILPRYLVKEKGGYQGTPTGDILQPFHLEIEIRARDLSFEELRQIYQTYRRTQPRKAKAFNEEHRAMYRLVKEKGGPVSGKGSVQFWKSVMKQWNTLHSKRRYSHWKGIKIAYDRINRKLENRQQSTQGEVRNERSQEVQERRQK